MKQSLMTLNRRSPFQQDCSFAINGEKPTRDCKRTLVSASLRGARGVPLEVAVGGSEWDSNSKSMDVGSGESVGV